MKIIEALKQIKLNKIKIAELTERIGQASANMSNEEPVYGEGTRTKLEGYLQSIRDLTLDNISLLTRISKTNLETQVSIDLGHATVTKSIAEWIWRRREYAEIERSAWRALTDRNLRAGVIKTSTGEVKEVTVVKHYDQEKRDNMVASLRAEPTQIDMTLEIVNATTDLLD